MVTPAAKVKCASCDGFGSLEMHSLKTPTSHKVTEIDASPESLPPAVTSAPIAPLHESSPAGRNTTVSPATAAVPSNATTVGMPVKTDLGSKWTSGGDGGGNGGGDGGDGGGEGGGGGGGSGDGGGGGGGLGGRGKA